MELFFDLELKEEQCLLVNSKPRLNYYMNIKACFNCFNRCCNDNTCIVILRSQIGEGMTGRCVGTIAGAWIEGIPGG